MLLRPISQPFKYRGFNPREMFASSEVGFIFDPSVMSSLWQNSTRTTPVTADGDPVGCMDDLSGNGFNALQAVAGSRPTFRTSGGRCWLEFDGLNDHLVMTATAADIARNRNHFAVVAGAERNSAGSNMQIFFASSGTSATAARVRSGTLTGSFSAGGRRLDADALQSISNVQAINTSYVGSGVFDYQNTALRLRQNAVQTAISTTFQTAGSTENTASLAVFLGRVDTSYLRGKIFSLVGLSSRQMTTAELLNTERWTAEKSGVTL